MNIQLSPIKTTEVTTADTHTEQIKGDSDNLFSNITQSLETPIFLNGNYQPWVSSPVKH